jgi:RNA-directed DNA polymerase
MRTKAPNCPDHVQAFCIAGSYFLTRLRAVVWTQWKRGPARFDELRRRGVGRGLALKTAGDPRGLWRLANSPALTMALSNFFFASLGLPSLAARRTS